jgi:protein-S-isoprenylcysteine O-methyltransferase Ste14
MAAAMSLLVRTLAGFVFLFAVMGLVVFAAAGSFGYWQGWLLIGVFAGASGVITAWLWVHDKALLERRVKAGPTSELDPVQRVIQALAGVVFLGVLLVPALDHRFAWSRAPTFVVLTGDALVALGFLVVFLVFRENTFTSGTIEIADDQRVIDTGPYALVRHPMYAGALVMFVGMPLALGSWWGLVVAAGIVPILAWRLLREETFLCEHLPGYPDYRRRTRFRLAPMLW